MTIKHIFTAILCTVSLASFAQTEKAFLDSAPVAPFGDTLFWIYGQLGAVSSSQRAAIVSDNIVLLRDDPFFNRDSLKVTVNGENCDIVYSGKTIAAITQEQAQYCGVAQMQIARHYSATVKSSIEKNKKSRAWLAVILRVAMGIGLLALTYLLIRYINRFHRKARIVIRKHKDRTIKKLYYILDANTQILIALWALKALRFLFILALLYLFMTEIFRLIPATRWISDNLLRYLIDPIKSFAVSTWEYVPDLIAIVIIVLIFRFIIRTIRMLANRIGEGKVVIKGFYPEWARATFNIIRAILVIFLIIFIFPHLPRYNSDAFKGVSVFVGLLLSLGSTSVIGNLIAGLIITYMRPFKVGDRIRVGENFGDVVEKNSLVTRIKTVKNEIITIPNLIVMSNQTTNYTSSAQQHGLILHTKITMGYDIPWRRIHELLIEAALKTPNIMSEPRPFVLQTALDDFYVQYEINVYTAEASKIIPIYSALNENIQDIFHRENIELLSPPVYELRPADHMAIPKEYVKQKNARTPPFRVAKQTY